MKKLINKVKEIYDRIFNPVVDIKSINCPKGYVVYHKDGNKHNNRKKNLIVISRAEMLARNLKKN